MKSLRPGTVVCQTFTCIFWVQAWARDACWVFSCIALHSIVWAWKFTILSRLVGRQLQGLIHLPQRWSSGHTSALPTGDEDLNSGLLVFTASALDSESSLQPQNCFFFFFKSTCDPFPTWCVLLVPTKDCQGRWVLWLKLSPTWRPGPRSTAESF